MEWTDADVKRAAKEGWKRQGGYVARVYDASGRCPLPHTFDVVEFLRSKGRKSEWHKQVYLSLPWTDADNQMLIFEGWQLVRQSIFAISPRRFYTNDAAREFFVARAEAGDPLYIKALSTLAKRRLIYGDQ